MSYICSQLLRASQYNKIVFLYLHFVVYSHLIYSIRGLMFQVKIENVKILYFFYPYSNLHCLIWEIKSGILTYAAMTALSTVQAYIRVSADN